MDEAKRSIIDDNQGTSFIGRVTGTPYFDEASDGACLLHLGLGYAYTRPRLRDEPDGSLRPVRFTARPEIHQGDPLITTGILDTQQFQLLNGELAWAYGPLTVQSETAIANLDLADGTTTNLWGSYVYGSWFLTGERRPYDRNFGVFRRVVPYENFWMVPTPRGTQAGLRRLGSCRTLVALELFRFEQAVSKRRDIRGELVLEFTFAIDVQLDSSVGTRQPFVQRNERERRHSCCSASD